MGRDKSQDFYFIIVPSFLYSCCAFVTELLYFLPYNNTNNKPTGKPEVTAQVKNLKFKTKLYLHITVRMEYSNGFTEIWSLEHCKFFNSTAFLAKSRQLPNYQCQR